MRIIRRQRGATLIEMVIGITILSLAGAALAAMMVHSLRGWSSGTSKEGAGTQATIAIQKIGNEIRDARTALASEDTHTLTVTFPRQLTDPTTHETIYDLSANDPATRSYYINSGNLVRNIGGQVTIITRGVSSVQFGADGGSVTVTLVGSDHVGMYTSTLQVTGRIYLRNYRS